VYFTCNDNKYHELQMDEVIYSKYIFYIYVLQIRIILCNSLVYELFSHCFSCNKSLQIPIDVNRSRKSKKYRKHNDQKKKDNNDTKQYIEN
jgi:hypothetical protein